MRRRDEPGAYADMCAPFDWRIRRRLPSCLEVNGPLKHITMALARWQAQDLRQFTGDGPPDVNWPANRRLHTKHEGSCISKKQSAARQWLFRPMPIVVGWGAACLSSSTIISTKSGSMGSKKTLLAQPLCLKYLRDFAQIRADRRPDDLASGS